MNAPQNAQLCIGVMEEVMYLLDSPIRTHDALIEHVAGALSVPASRKGQVVEMVKSMMDARSRQLIDQYAKTPVHKLASFLGLLEESERLMMFRSIFLSVPPSLAPHAIAAILRL